MKNPIARPVRSISSFSAGLAMPMRALRLLSTRPAWWWLVLVPLAINLVLFTVAIVWGFTAFADWLHPQLEGMTAWYWALLRIAAQVLFWLVVLVAVYFVFTPVALVIAAPFNDRLAELAERECGIALPVDGRPLVRAVAAEAAFAVVAEVKRMAVVLGVFVVLLPLHFVPAVGSVIYIVASFYFAARFAAIEFMSYAADRRHLAFGAKWGATRRHHALCMGFGLVTLGLLAVPFVNTFVVSLSAIGGTMLYARTTDGTRGA